MIIKKNYKAIILHILFFLFYNINKENKVIKKPPKKNNEYSETNDYIHKLKENNRRNNFQDEINKRKLFNINYNFEPYINYPKNLSFEDYAIYIYNKTGMLNITKLEFYFQNKNINNNYSLLNNIHISMSFNKNYTDLSLLSIASILNTSNNDTYIHFHILGLNFTIIEIKKLIDMRRINNQVEFIFYNAKQAEYDFTIGLKDHRGIGNYAKILIPQIINNTDKILIVDSGDILCQKDLTELFFYDIGDNYFGWVMDQCAGNFLIKGDKFMTNNFHPNTGVILVNIKLFRRDLLYEKALFMSKSYNKFSCPTQDILITIANYKFKFIPLKYNLHIYYTTEKEKIMKIRTKWIKNFIETQRFSPYRYTVNEIFDAMDSPVIYHFYLRKIQHRQECDKIVIEWINYSKLAGVYEILKKKFPKPFFCETKFNFTYI